MVYCTSCKEEVELEVDEANGFSCCAQCGRVHEDIAFSSDVLFQKGADGEGGMVGQIVGQTAGGLSRGAYGGEMEGHESSAARGYAELSAIAERFHMSYDIIDAAHRLYKLALQKGFTRGRRVNQVAATCLYIVCRQDRKPYMLIDFSDLLSVNVFTLGAVYLQLLRVFNLEDCPVFTKPIDPSLYLHRFTEKLKFGPEKSKEVGNTALHLVQSMKRDWMQTGRRPSGICGAALFIAAHIHGFERSKQDIISVVHIGWGTVEKRIREFASTATGELTWREFEELAKSLEPEHEGRLLALDEQHSQQVPALPGLEIEEEEAEEEVEEENSQPVMLALPSVPGEGEGALSAVNEVVSGGSQAEEGALVPQVKKKKRKHEDENTSGKFTSCEHVLAGSAPSFAHRMCRDCFMEYLRTSGGIYQGAANPPAFTNNLRRELREKLKSQAKPDASEENGFGDEPQGQEGSADDANLASIPDPEVAEMEAALHRPELAPITEALTAKQKGGPLSQRSGRTGRVRTVASLKAAAAAEAAAAASGAGTSGFLPQGSGSVQDEKIETGAASSLAEEGLQPAAKGSWSNVVADAPDQTAKRLTRKAAAEAAAAAVNLCPEHSPNIGAVGEENSREELGGQENNQGTGGSVMTVGVVDGGLGIATYDPNTLAIVAVEEEEEELSSLSGDEDLNSYIATNEEAELKCLLWTEMNKDWLEKQAAKEAAAAAAGERPQSERRRRATKKKVLPPADTATDAARNMLESKKLSNKINYNILANMFDAPSDMNQDPGQRPEYGGEEEEDQVATAAAGMDEGGYGSNMAVRGRGGRRVVGSGSGLSGEFGAEPATSVSAALQQRAQRKAADKEQSMNKYSHVLEKEAKRRGVVVGTSAVSQSPDLTVGGGEGPGGSGTLPTGSLGGLGGLSGGFLGSLTFASKQGSGLKATANRPRPSGLRDR